MSNYDFDLPGAAAHKDRERSYDVGDRYLDHAGSYNPPKFPVEKEEEPVSCSDNEQDGYDYIKKRNQELKGNTVADYTDTRMTGSTGDRLHSIAEEMHGKKNRISSSGETKYYVKQRSRAGVTEISEWDSRKDALQALELIRRLSPTSDLAKTYYGEQTTIITETEEF
jgi:hypothetical protein